MDRRWTSHLQDPEEKKRFVAYLLNSKGVFDRLTAIINQLELELEEKELQENIYDSPSWAARQADINGYRRCLRRITKLINLDQKE